MGIWKLRDLAAWLQGGVADETARRGAERGRWAALAGGSKKAQMGKSRARNTLFPSSLGAAQL